MSSMLKLLAISILLSSWAFAESTQEKVVDFLESSFESNPSIISVDIEIADTIDIENMKNWKAYVVAMDAEVKTKKKGKNRQVKQRTIWFSNGALVTQDLIDLDTGLSLKELVAPSFKPKHYKKENLIYGNANAKHKVAIFSDPLCPFCRTFVPKAISYMKKFPNKFAIYYYHFPLPTIHPAAVVLVKAAEVAELQGKKDVVLNLYKVKVNAREKDINKILKAFNETMDTDVKVADIKSAEVLKRYSSNQNIASELMVGGTPTIFFDGKVDKTKRKYKKAK